MFIEFIIFSLQVKVLRARYTRSRIRKTLANHKKRGKRWSYCSASFNVERPNGRRTCWKCPTSVRRWQLWKTPASPCPVSSSISPSRRCSTKSASCPRKRNQRNWFSWDPMVKCKCIPLLTYWLILWLETPPIFRARWDPYKNNFKLTENLKLSKNW